MLRRSKRRKSQCNTNSSLPPSITDVPSLPPTTANTYKAYGTTLMNNGHYFNCSCNDDADYSHCICCDYCGNTWSHYDCVVPHEMDSYSLSKYVYVCFNCRGIHSEEDRQQKDANTNSNTNSHSVPIPPPISPTVEAPNIKELPIGKSKKLHDLVYDKKSVKNVYVHEHNDEHKTRDVYFEYGKKKNFNVKFDFEYFMNDMVDINKVLCKKDKNKKKKISKTEIFKDGSGYAALQKLYASAYEKKMPQYGCYVDVC